MWPSLIVASCNVRPQAARNIEFNAAVFGETEPMPIASDVADL